MKLPQSIIDPVPPEFEIGWELRFARPEEELQSVRSEDLPETERIMDGDSLKIVWSAPHLLGSAFTVVAEFRRVSGRLAAGLLRWSPPAEPWRIEEVIFPRVTLPYPPDGDFITGLWDMGWRRRGEMRFSPGETERIPCESMQFSALLSASQESFYFDHRDPAWYTKALDVACAENGRSFTMGAVFFPSLDDQENVNCRRIPYETNFGFFRGDWFEAAAIYREWAQQQEWNLRRSSHNPLRNIDLWVWNRGSSEAVAPILEKLAAETGGEVNLALNWYWWHHNPYDTDYPDFWPPREGTEAFTQTAERLRGLGIHTQTYVNGLCWDMDGGSWSDGGEESAVVLRDGNVKAIAFNRFNHHRLAYMCGESPRFAARLAEVVGHLRDAGLGGQYLDMIGCGSSSLCNNPHHRHPKHGGNYNVPAFRELLKRLGGPSFPITTECANEPFMCETEGAAVCSSLSAEHIGFPRETLPLFAAVYHGKYALFGSYASPDGIPPWDPLWPPAERWKTEKPWHQLYPDQFFLEIARAVAWGVQPMVCNLRESFWSDESFAESRRFLLEIARFWHDNRKFLFDGEMLAPGEMHCATHRVTFLVRMIFTKESECRETTREFPAILHSRWRAPDKACALILVNHTATPQIWSCGRNSGTMPPHSCQIVPEFFEEKKVEKILKNPIPALY